MGNCNQNKLVCNLQTDKDNFKAFDWHENLPRQGISRSTEINLVHVLKPLFDTQIDSDSPSVFCCVYFVCTENWNQLKAHNFFAFKTTREFALKQFRT